MDGGIEIILPDGQSTDIRVIHRGCRNVVDDLPVVRLVGRVEIEIVDVDLAGVAKTRHHVSVDDDEAVFLHDLGPPRHGNQKGRQIEAPGKRHKERREGHAVSLPGAERFRRGQCPLLIIFKGELPWIEESELESLQSNLRGSGPVRPDFLLRPGPHFFGDVKWIHYLCLVDLDLAQRALPGFESKYIVIETGVSDAGHCCDDACKQPSDDI